MLWTKEVEMVDSLDELKSSRSVYGKDFPNFEMLVTNIEFPAQEEGQPRGAESPKRGPVSTRKTDRLHDLRLLSSDWRSWHSIRWCWFLLCYFSWWQHSGNRYKMGRSSIVDVKNSIRDILESLFRLRLRESDQLKSLLELYDMEIHQKISVPNNYQKLKTMEKRWQDQKLRLRQIEARGKKKTSVRKETITVSATKPKIVRKNQKTLPPHLLSQPYHEVEVCRGREVSEAKVTMGPFFDNRADIVWMVLARERLQNVGIRLSANSLKMKRFVRRETSVCFRITRLMNNQKKSKKQLPKKKRKRREECCGYCEKCFTIGSVSQDSDALVSQGRKFRGKPDAESLATNSKDTIHKVHATSCEYPGKERTIVGKNKCQSSSSAKSLRYEFWGQVPWRAAMCPKQGSESC